MKLTQSACVMVATAFGLAAYCSAVIGTGQGSTSVSSTLDKEVTQLELTWTPGVGIREHEYYARAGKFADGLSIHEQVIANAAAVKLLSNLLSKKTESFETREADFDVGAADLVAMEKLARFLLGNDNVLIKQRREKLTLLAKLLGRVRAEIVPDYVAKRVVANVGPPAGVPGMAGMNPEAIADPVAREKYKAAILKNQLNNLMNERQGQLHYMETQFAKPIVEYISRVAASDRAARDIVHQAVLDARLTPLENTEVAQALKP